GGRKVRRGRCRRGERMKWPGRESPDDLARSAGAEKTWTGAVRLPVVGGTGDLDAVTALEAQCNTQPWSREALKAAFLAQAAPAAPDSNPKAARTIALVAVNEGAVIGYILASAV